MVGVEDVALVALRVTQLVLHVELVLDPERTRFEKGGQAARRDAQIRLEDALELEQGLVVEAHVRQVLGRYAARPEAVGHGATRERRFLLLAGEPLLLRGGNDLAVSQETGGAVVVEGRYTQDVRDGHALESQDAGRLCKRRAPEPPARGLDSTPAMLSSWLHRLRTPPAAVSRLRNNSRNTTRFPAGGAGGE